MGWVKLHRSLLDNEIWKDKPYARGQAWVDLILLSNYEAKTFLLGSTPVDVKEGEVITSLSKLAERWGWSTKKVGRFLDGLESGGMVSQKRNGKYTAITLVNWALYQVDDKQEETQKKRKGNAEETQRKTNKNIRNKKIISICDNQREYDFEELERTLAGKL